jgi:hypothetical protein
MVPEAQNPDSPYNILAGLPYDLAVKAIAGIAQDTAKIRAEGVREQAKATKERELAMPVSAEEVTNYSALTGLPADVVKTMRISALEEYAKSKSDAPGKVQDRYLKVKDAFNGLAAVKAWDVIKPNVGTIKSIAEKLKAQGQLLPTEQAQLMIAFKDIATQGGGAARMTEDTLNIVENKGRWGQIVDAITSGAPVSLSPQEARDVVNAASFKVNAIKSGYNDEKNKFRDILLKDDRQAQDFVFDEGTDAATINMGEPTTRPGQIITEEIDGDVIVYKVNPDGKTKKRIK